MAGEHNPALSEFAALVGTWEVTLSSASFLDDAEATLSGTTTLEWLDGAFIVMRSAMEGGPPRSTSVIGRSEAEEAFSMLYHDERGVSRIYAMTFDGAVWTLSRADPDFFQRFTGRLIDGGDTIDAEWEQSHDEGVSWEHDFNLTYRRRA